jgi:hypothetical protein
MKSSILWSTTKLCSCMVPKFRRFSVDSKIVFQRDEEIDLPLRHLFGLMVYTGMSLSAANLSVSVISSGGESAALCSNQRSDGYTATCYGSSSADRYGSAASSYYSPGDMPYLYTWTGNVQATVKAGTVGLISRSSIDFTNEYASFTGTKVVVTNICTAEDCQAVDVYDGDTKVNTLPGGSSLEISFLGSAIKPKIVASQLVGPTDRHPDYVGFIDVTIQGY